MTHAQECTSVSITSPAASSRRPRRSPSVSALRVSVLASGQYVAALALAIFVTLPLRSANAAGACAYDAPPTSKPTRVLPNPNLATILWNSNVRSEVQSNAPLFYSDLDEAGSTYLNSLKSDYGVSTGIYRGMFTIAPHTYNNGTSTCAYNTGRCSGGACLITECDIDAELKYQISNNSAGIPTPEGDGVDASHLAKNLLYVVHLPPNYLLALSLFSGHAVLTPGSPTVTFTVSQSLSVGQPLVFSAQPGALYTISTVSSPTSVVLTTPYTGPSSTTGSAGIVQCGSHRVMQDALGNYAPVAYLADFSPGTACAGLNYTGLGTIQDQFFTASHEVIEAVVNPFGGQGEIGDYCQCSTNFTGYPGIGGQAEWTTFAGFWRTWVVQQPYMLSTHSCQPMQIFPATANNANNSSGFASYPTSTGLDDYWAPGNGTLYGAFWVSGSGWTSYPIYTGGPIVGNSQIASVHLPFLANAFYIGSSGNVVASQLAILNGWQTTNVTGPGSATGVTYPAPPGGRIAAVANGNNALAVYFADNSGALRGLGWSSTAPGNGWSVFLANPLATNVPPGASIAVVRRSNINTDVFFIGNDGGIWQMSETGILGSWTESEIPGTAGRAVPGSSIAAVARAWNKLDVFFVDGVSGFEETASWSEGDNNDQWFLDSTVSGPTVGGAIAAVTRSPWDMDSFFIDGQGVENVRWSNWTSSPFWTMSLAQGSANFAVGGPIAATAITPVRVDAFNFTTSGVPFAETFVNPGPWASSQP